jgi:predicted SAM-dependent methyltransferase
MTNKKIYVNLGCGVNIMKDEKNIHWINVDKFFKDKSGAKNFLEGDVIDIPLEKETADYIICDQVMEHLRMDDVPVALNEIRRILKKGGKAVLIIPDFRSAALDWMSFDWEAGFNAIPYQFLSEVLFGNQNHEGEYHKTPFCAGYLHYVLNMVGLRNHELQFHPKGALPPKHPGVYFLEGKTALRNSQLVAIITK